MGEWSVMPKIDIVSVPEIRGTGYPRQFNAACAERIRQRLGDAGGLADFGVNLMRLPPGNWSSQIGSRSAEDVTTCSDIDMMSAHADGRFEHKDGTPYEA
jgi:uncharacterized cupin superfamily protein